MDESEIKEEKRDKVNICVYHDIILIMYVKERAESKRVKHFHYAI